MGNKGSCLTGRVMTPKDLTTGAGVQFSQCKSLLPKLLERNFFEVAIFLLTIGFVPLDFPRHRPSKETIPVSLLSFVNFTSPSRAMDAAGSFRD